MELDVTERAMFMDKARKGSWRQFNGRMGYSTLAKHMRLHCPKMDIGKARQRTDLCPFCHCWIEMDIKMAEILDAYMEKAVPGYWGDYPDWECFDAEHLKGKDDLACWQRLEKSSRWQQRKT